MLIGRRGVAHPMAVAGSELSCLEDKGTPVDVTFITCWSGWTLSMFSLNTSTVIKRTCCVIYLNCKFGT